MCIYYSINLKREECGNYDIIGNLIIYVYIKRCFIVFIQSLLGLCLPIVCHQFYGTCVYFAYNKVTTYNQQQGQPSDSMATHGKISTFNSTVELWMSYCECLHFYFDANDIVDPGKKRSILLVFCGPSIYQFLKSLVQPRTPMEKTYDEIVETLKTHFNPKLSPIIQRLIQTFLFHEIFHHQLTEYYLHDRHYHYMTYNCSVKWN